MQFAVDPVSTPGIIDADLHNFDFILGDLNLGVKFRNRSV
jgi:hypothetical protein